MITLSLKIQLEKESYYPGEKVKGVLSINVPKPLRARMVQISFVGREQTRIERGGGRYRRVYEEENLIVVKSINIWEAPKVQLFGPCDELFPFEFLIPEHALPSVVTRENIHNGILYEVMAKIDRPRSLDPKAYCEVHVAQPGYETYPTEPIERSREDFEGKMELRVSIDKDVFTPGENVTGNVILKKDPSVKVLSVDIGVVCIGSFTAEGVTDAFRVVADTLHCEVDPSGEYYKWPFDLNTPEGGKYSLYGKLVKRLWEVEVTANLPLKRNRIVDVPLLFVPLRNPAKP